MFDHNMHFLPSDEPEGSSGWPEEECEPQLNLFPPSAVLNPQWERVVLELTRSLTRAARNTWRDVLRVEMLEKELLLVKNRVIELEDACQVTVPIQSLAPEPYQVIKPILAVVRRRDEEYLATFYDANLNASGETEREAVVNLKDIIVATVELLTEHDWDALAPGAARQRYVLEEFIHRAD